MINFGILKSHHLQDCITRCENLQLFGKLYDAACAELARRGAEGRGMKARALLLLILSPAWVPVMLLANVGACLLDVVCQLGGHHVR